MSVVRHLLSAVWAGAVIASAGTPSPAPGPAASGGDACAAVIDASVSRRLTRLGVEPSDRCSDATFVRRVYLDAIGTLPSAAEVRGFLEERDARKREALVDRLLARDEFADYWAMKWCDLLRVKSEFPINLWPNAVQAYHRWIRTALKENVPYDRFARELLTASGSNFRVPQVNFYRAVQAKTPEGLAQAAALAFLGERTETWPAARRDGLAAFFSQVGYKATSEWKEEIVYFNPAASNALMSAVFPDGAAVEFAPDQDPRAVFAEWLTSPRNATFARCEANRVWAWLMGRGIVDEPDDFRPDNPPSNSELLDLLARALVDARFDAKRLYAAILKSQTYQRDSVPRSTDPSAERNFAFCAVRRLDAEVLIDALNRITGSGEKYTSNIPEPFSHIPESLRTIALADGSITSPFLSLYGRSPRETGLFGERPVEPTAAQRLHLLNSSHIQRKLEGAEPLFAALRQEGMGPREIADELFLTILSRHPTDDELAAVAAYRSQMGPGRRVALDLAWALVNTAEFQYRH